MGGSDVVAPYDQADFILGPAVGADQNQAKQEYEKGCSHEGLRFWMNNLQEIRVEP